MAILKEPPRDPSLINPAEPTSLRTLAMFDTQFLPPAEEPAADTASNNDVFLVLQQLLQVQERQMELLEELVEQRREQADDDADTKRWRESNPGLANSCGQAAQTLNQVQVQMVEELADEVNCHGDELMDSDFVLNELIDRYGPRLAHLNGVLQMLSQLGGVPTTAQTK